MPLDERYRLAYAKIHNMIASFGVPLGLDILIRIDDQANNPELLKIRSEIQYEIVRNSLDIGVSIREDGYVFLFLNIYTMVFLPASLAGPVEAFERWRSHIGADVRSILMKAKEASEENARKTSTLLPEREKTISASDILIGWGECYHSLVLRSGWLNPFGSNHA